MSIELVTDGFENAWERLNGFETPPVKIPELVNRAITVGGVPRSGTARQRSHRRSSVAELVLSSIEVSPVGALQPTALYRDSEPTEKGAISFRLGMAFAAIAASRKLQVRTTQHVSLSSRAGRRADLVGIDRMRRPHLIEAKGRWGGVAAALTSGKTQAGDTPGNFETRSVCVADFGAANGVRVTLRDPPLDGDFTLDLDALLLASYRPVLDLLETEPEASSGIDELDEAATGAWLPGTEVWLGLDRALLRAAMQANSVDAATGFAEVWVEHTDQVVGLPEIGAKDSRVGAAADGHVVVVGPHRLR